MSGFFRCEVKTLSKSTGQSAAAAHGYDARERARDKSDLAGCGMVNMPAWTGGDPGKYWAACDSGERANGLLARRAILSFPVELSVERRDEVVVAWLGQNCQGMPASWHAHDDGTGNPHAHVLISERLNDGVARAPETWFKRWNSADPARGGARKADVGSRRKEWLADARKSWADALNTYLPDSSKVDHRSLRDRGVFDRDPQPKIGAKVLGAELRGHRTKLMSSVLEDASRKCTVRCLSFRDESGKEVTFRAARDFQDRIELVGKPSRAKCVEIVKMCREKGWVSVEVTGDAEFQQMMRAELRRAGINVAEKEKNEEKNHEQNSAGDRAADGRGVGQDGEQSGAERAGGPAPARPRHEQNQGSSRRPGRRDDAPGADAERSASEGAAAPADATPSAAGGVAADRGRAADRVADRRADIRTLAGTEDAVSTDKKTRGSDMSKTVNVNLTEVQVRRQLDSMLGVETFEVGIRDGRSGKMMNLEMGAGDVLASLPRLKRENARGCDIYVRPSPRGEHPYALLDDVGAGTISKMKFDGIEPVLEVETSPQNYQVWVRLPESIHRSDRKAVERLLGGRYGSDLNSADGGHYGRLAGFTNRKPSRVQDDGRAPFCKLSAHRARATATLPQSIWTGLKAAAEQRQADEIADAPAPQALPLPGAPAPGGVIDFQMASASAKRQYASARARWGATFDPSRADYFVARNLMQRGATPEVARRAVALRSPDLESRKSGHVDDYLDRTIQKAYESIPGLSDRDRRIVEGALRAQEQLLADRVREDDRQRHLHQHGRQWDSPKPKV